MPTTTKYALPYPALTDPADVPADIKELADAVDLVIPTPGLVRIFDQRLAAPAANINIPAIPQTYSHLRLVVIGRDNTAGVGITALQMFLNGDAAANYDQQILVASGAVATSVEQLAQPAIGAGLVSAGGCPAGIFSTNIYEFPDYTGPAQKTVSIQVQGKINNTPGSSALNLRTVAAYWRNTAAITSIGLAPNAGSFVAGTRATLYGLI